jgi:hypothetical protein
MVVKRLAGGRAAATCGQALRAQRAVVEGSGQERRIRRQGSKEVISKAAVKRDDFEGSGQKRRIRPTRRLKGGQNRRTQSHEVVNHACAVNKNDAVVKPMVMVAKLTCTAVKLGAQRSN